MPPWRSPTVAISLRSTPIVTSVCAISGERPVTMTVAPSRREASTVCTRWFATFESMAATPVMSITTTFARLLRVDDADDRQNQQALAHLQHRGGELPDRLLLLPDDTLALLHEADGHRIRDAVGRRLVGVEDAVELVEVSVVLGEQRAGEHVTQ